MPTWSTFGVWGLVCLGVFGVGILLLVLGLRPRRRGTEPHCAACDYNLTGVASDVCPECGTERSPANVVHGERYRRPQLAVVGALLATIGLASSVPVLLTLMRTPTPKSLARSRLIPDMKARITDLRGTFTAGQAECKYNDGSGRWDSRVPVLADYIQRVMPGIMTRRITDAATRTAVLAELAAASQLLQTKILPAHETALTSGDPADAKALVPLMDELDKYMDNLLRILKGY